MISFITNTEVKQFSLSHTQKHESVGSAKKWYPAIRSRIHCNVREDKGQLSPPSASKFLLRWANICTQGLFFFCTLPELKR